MTDYEVLGLSSSATLEEIKKRFHQLVKMNHPDKYDREADLELWNLANERMTQITEAYRRLSDKCTAEKERARQEYEAAEAARREYEVRQRAEAERQRKYREERLRREAEDRQRAEAERERQAELDERMKASDIATAKEYKAKIKKELVVKHLVGVAEVIDVVAAFYVPLEALVLGYGVGCAVVCLLFAFGILFVLYTFQKGDSIEDLKSRLDFAKTFPTDLDLGRYLRKKNFG